MRIFELTTRINSIRRSAGRTATAAAAYRSGTSISCVYAQTEHDYSRKGGVVFSKIVLPDDAPLWAANRSALWNAAELVEKNGKRGKNAGAWKATAQTAREVMFSFPHELSQEGREAVAGRVAEYLAATGVAVDVNIHAPGREGDQRNWHCHILTTTRVFVGDEFGPKVAWQTNRAASRALSKDVRAFIAETANARLKAEGKADVVHVEHRSFKARGIARQPQLHDGPSKTGANRRDKRVERSEWEKKQSNELRAKQKSENKKLRAAQNTAWRVHSVKWARTTRKEVKSIVEAARAERKADLPVSGIKGFLLRLTGRAKSIERQRQERAQNRIADVRQQIGNLRAQISEGKVEVRTEQQQERQRVKDLHADETMQLTRAFAASASRDLSMEQVGRENEALDRGDQREIGGYENDLSPQPFR